MLQFRTPDEAESVFYEAFQRCDEDVMAGVWADDDVVCVHPGAGALVGHDAVTRSWSHIFSDAHEPDIRYTVAKRSLSHELAVHIVVEEMRSAGTVTAVVFATNVYRKYEGGWLMIEHHASLVQNQNNGQTLQ